MVGTSSENLGMNPLRKRLALAGPQASPCVVMSSRGDRGTDARQAFSADSTRPENPALTYRCPCPASA